MIYIYIYHYILYSMFFFFNEILYKLELNAVFEL